MWVNRICIIRVLDVFWGRVTGTLIPRRSIAI
jgi:hypothetical protein